MVHEHEVRATVGDTVVLASPGHSGRNPDRCGEIVELVGVEQSHYVVRWLDGRVSMVSPTAATVVSAQRP